MAKLPARQKVNVLFFRHTGPDEILVIQRGGMRAIQWALPFEEARPGESARDVAHRLAESVVDGDPIGEIDLGVGATYRVNAGPRAGEWTERFYALEMASDCPATQGRWFAHFDAKAQAGAEAPRVREAVSRLRELASLKP